MIFTISLGAVIQSLIGIVTSQKFNDHANEMHGEDFDKMREGVTNIFYAIQKDKTMPSTVLVVECRTVRVIHPLIWGFLKQWNLLKDDKNQQKPILINLLRVMKLDRTFFRSVSQMKWNFFKPGINKRNLNRY